MRMADTPWAVEILEEGAGILRAIGCKWWLSSGTMLGLHREGKLLDHDDPDLDVGVLEPVNHELIKESFAHNSFELFAEGSHQLIFKKKKVLFDIYFYRREKDKLVCEIHGLGKIIKPAGLFDKLGSIKFRNHLYPTPKPIEGYLVVRYGPDWYIPKKKKESWIKETPALIIG